MDPLVLASLIWGAGTTVAAGIYAWGKRQGRARQTQESQAGDIDELKEDLAELQGKVEQMDTSGLQQRVDSLRRDVKRHERYFESLIPRELDRGGAFRLREEEES